MQKNSTIFENKIKPILVYIGTIGSILMIVAYIIIVLVLIFGFQVKSMKQTLTFAIVNAIVGLIIMQFLKIQGIDFAKQLPENKAVLEQYWNTKTKDKKPRSIKYFWIKTIILDVILKGLSVVITTTGIIYIVIEGSNDFALLLLALVNLILFICFGLLSLVKGYDFFNEQHIPYIKEKLKEVKKDKELCLKEMEKNIEI